jgi:hypothetical protein
MNTAKKSRLISDATTPYKLDDTEGTGSARAYINRVHFDAGLAYGVVEKKTPSHNSTMRNSMYLQVPRGDSSADVYHDAHEHLRQRSNFKFLKQVNFDDLVPTSQYNASFDLSANMLRGTNVYRHANAKSIRNEA